MTQFLERTNPKITRVGWGSGPWDGEPDRIEWRFMDLPCLMVRNQMMGAWCGYVAVPPGHPWHGLHNDAVENVAVHGGLTYAGQCQKGSEICHAPLPGESDDVWWLGFDCAHCDDLAPGMGVFRLIMRDQQYRTRRYVRKEVERLAVQARCAERGLGDGR